MDTLKRIACWLGIGVSDTGVCKYLSSDIPSTEYEPPVDEELEVRIHELEVRVSLIERRQDIIDHRRESRRV